MIVALPKALTLRVLPQGSPLKRIGSRPAVNFGSLKGRRFLWPQVGLGCNLARTRTVGQGLTGVIYWAIIWMMSPAFRPEGA